MLHYILRFFFIEDDSGTVSNAGELRASYRASYPR